MITEFQILDTEDFYIEHLLDNQENIELIKLFSVPNNAIGLENYLKNQSTLDEKRNNCRTYLIKDKSTNELVSYFSLKTGLITMQLHKEYFESIPAIELSNFAVNHIYRQKHPEISKIGSYSFKYFILPLVRCLSKFVGINSLYIYALPQEKLIEHYRTLGFTRLPKKQEKFVQYHVKPKYDEGCIFMYQIL